jgi:hypothetical protein
MDGTDALVHPASYLPIRAPGARQQMRTDQTRSDQGSELPASTSSLPPLQFLLGPPDPRPDFEAIKANTRLNDQLGGHGRRELGKLLKLLRLLRHLLDEDGRVGRAGHGGDVDGAPASIGRGGGAPVTVSSRGASQWRHSRVSTGPRRVTAGPGG